MPDETETPGADADYAPAAGKVSPVIPFTIAGSFLMQGINSSSINTSLPQIAKSLGATPVELSIAITSYILSLAVFIPVSGWIADRYGARRVYCTAIVVFTIGSAMCGFATNLETLVAMRILQGFGGAMMTPVGRLILARSFPKEQLIRAMNYMQVPATIGPLLGPVLGGSLTTYVSWRWIFFINIPLGMIAIPLTLKLIKDIRMPRPPALDIRGFLIVGLGLAMAQLSLEYVGRRVIPVPGQLALIAAAAVMLTAYWLHARSHPAPVLDLTLFRIRTFSVSVLGGSVSRIAVGSFPFLLPLLFQVGFGLDAFHSGLLIVISTLGVFCMRMGVPALLRKFGMRWTLMGNAVILGVMLIGCTLLHANTPIWFLTGYLFVFGLVRAVQNSSLSALSFADLPTELMSKGTSISAVSQRLSQSAGIAIAATLLALFSHGGARGSITTAEFAPVFIIIGLLEIASALGYRRLAPTDAMILTGHRGGRRHAALAEAQPAESVKT